MFLGQNIPEINREGLRQFGLIFSAIVIAIFGLLVPFLFEFSWPKWPWIVAFVVGGLALLAPNILSPFYQIWMRFGIIMNIIMSRVILGLVFVLTVVPTGLIMRLRGKDLLNVKLDSSLPSYRDEVSVKDNKHLRKPF